MLDRLRELADRFVERGRSELEVLLQGMDDEGRREVLGPTDASQPLPGLFSHFLSMTACDSGASREDLAALEHLSPDIIDLLREFLMDMARMHFVRRLLRETLWTPPELTFGLTRVSVYTVDVTLCKKPLRLCARSYPRRTHDALMLFLRSGSPWEAQGACPALFWFDAIRSARIRKLEPTGAAPHLAILERFVRNEDIDFRRAFAGKIGCCPSLYPRAARGLLEEARGIVLSHEDPCVRERFLHDTPECTFHPPFPGRPLEPPAGGGVAWPST